MRKNRFWLIAEAKELPFAEDTDFTVTGSKLVGDVLLVFQSAVQVEKESWSDSVYQYELPYVAWSKYDLHVLNLVNGSVNSFSDLHSDALQGLRGPVGGCKEAVLSEARLRVPFLREANRKAVNRCIYTLDQFFLVEQGRLLIFSLRDLENEKIYYSLDLSGLQSPPQLCLPSELAAKYPDELVVTERPPRNPMEDRVLTVSAKQYRVEHSSLLPSGLVILGQENLNSDSPYLDPLYSDHRTVVGIRPIASTRDSLERVWQYDLIYDEGVDTFIEDQKSGAVYFPEQMAGWFTTKFKVQALAAATGQPFDAFPANFKTKVATNGKYLNVSIVGTVPDFDRKVAYVHDYDGNRIVCLSLRGSGTR